MITAIGESNTYNLKTRAGAVSTAERRNKMKLSDTKEYQNFLSVLKNVENEGLRVVLEDAACELVKKSFSIGWDKGHERGSEIRKDVENA